MRHFFTEETGLQAIQRKVAGWMDRFYERRSGRRASGLTFLIPYRAGQTALQVQRALPLQNAGSVRPRLLWFPILVAQFFVVPVRAWLRRASLPLVCCRWNSGR